jgi:hypothetical protein
MHPVRLGSGAVTVVLAPELRSSNDGTRATPVVGRVAWRIMPAA